MKILHFLTLITLTCLSGKSMGINDTMLTPSQIMSESTLIKEIELQNDAGIYLKITNFFDDGDSVKSRVDGLNSRNVNVVWLRNTEADKKPFVLKFPQKTTILQIFREVAAHRGEQLVVSPNYIAILPTLMTLKSSYQIKGERSSVALEQQIEAFIPVPIIIGEASADDLETFINAKFQQTWSLSNKAGNAPFALHIDKKIRAKIKRLNVNGHWSYRDLFDVISFVSGTQWQINGDAIQFVP